MRLERSIPRWRAAWIVALLFPTASAAQAQYLDFERTSLPFVGSPGPATAADFDGDGFADLAVVEGPYLNLPPRLRLYHGPHPGPAPTLIPFPSAVVPPWGSFATGVLDFDGDGLQDLAVGVPFSSFAGTNSGLVQMFLGPSLAPGPLFFPPFPTGSELFGSTVATPDLNGDGLPDLARSSWGG